MMAVRSVVVIWGPSPPNEVGKTAQYDREGEGRKNGKDWGLFSVPAEALPSFMSCCKTLIYEFVEVW